MKKFFARLCAVVLALALVLPASAVSAADYSGKTVILHTNDVHGNIEGYAYMKALKTRFEKDGAEVILVDAGDYSQGTTLVSLTKGADAVRMMNKVGYDVVTIGNHEFDFGYAQLMENMKEAKFKVVCADVFDADGKPIFDANYTLTTKSGLKIGFFGMETPEAQTKANPAIIQGLKFLAGKDMYKAAQEQVTALKGADLVICLSHLGNDASSEPNTSYDLLKNVSGIDFLIDGHSHAVYEKGSNGETMQQTGTKFANIGVIVIDNKTRKIEKNYLYKITEEAAKDKKVADAAQAIIDKVNAEYGVVFAKSEVELVGDKEPNRTHQTNNGDLTTDAMMWAITKNPESIKVDRDHIVVITNGGGIRDWIHKGDVTYNNILSVHSFMNTLAVVYVSGSELLEALEASTFSLPASVAGYPQLAGMDITVDTTKAYKANTEPYPASTYYGPASINRVKINSVNGKAFNINDTYAVITNNFCANGGDTYYAFASATEQFDTGLRLDEAVIDYIKNELGGVIGTKYAEAQERAHIITEKKVIDKVTIGGLDQNIWTTKYGNMYCDIKVEDFFDVLGFDWGDLVDVTINGQTLTMPVVPTYSYVDTGVAAIIATKGGDGKPSGYLSFAINMGNFAETYGIATKGTDADGNWYWTAKEGVKFPMEIKFKMAEEDGYAAEYILHDLSRTNERADYAGLTDEQFANFRAVATTGMGKNILYRSSNPVNPELARNEIADKAAKQAGVKTFINLADSEDELEAYAPYADSYYATQNVIALCLGVDFSEESFKEGLAKGFRFIIDNKGPYLVHCTEGKDRAGFTAALLECLMGAAYDEVIKDYMVTYYNYYGIEEGTDKYNAIANANIIKTLQSAFGVSDLKKADLAKEAAEYLGEIGLTNAEIAALKANLSANVLPKTGAVSAVLFYAIGSMLIAAGATVTGKNRKEE